MAKRKIKVEDLRRFKFVSDPQISPDGSRVAFVVSVIDYKGNKYRRGIWLVDTESGELSQFTHGPGSDNNPRWSPDGKKLLFLAKGREKDKKTQLYTISLSGGEAQLIVDMENGVGNPEWSPDGKLILFTTRTWIDKKPETDVKHIKRIRYKFNNMGFFPGKRVQLYTVRPGRKPKKVAKGEYDVNNPRWARDGKSITFITNMDEDADISRVQDIFRIEAKGGEPIKLTDGRFSIANHSHSPDGSTIAFIGHDQPLVLAVDYDLWTMPSGGGEPRLETGGFDRSLMMGIGSDLRVGSPNPGAVWGSEGESVYFNTTDTPYLNIYRLKLGEKIPEALITGKTAEGFSVADSGAVAFVAMNATSPTELFLHDGDERKLSGFNDRVLSGLDLVEPEHFTFKNRLGRTVDGWLMKPVGWEEGKSYPCVLEMHGGPRGVYGDGIYHEFQLLTAEGYAVIFTNPRGSAGYEEPYTQAVMRRYGEVDTEDFLDFTDEALRRYPWIDESRLGLTGGSYGGYTTNWIISHSDRFRAAVTCRSICNWVSKFGVSDIGFMQPESISGEKTYWGEALVHQMRHSPLYHVDNVKTPCLIIHSEQDYRCPIAEAEQWFTALKLLGVPTELVRFPEENHELSRSGKPKHREERLEHILRWFRKYLK